MANMANPGREGSMGRDSTMDRPRPVNALSDAAADVADKAATALENAIGSAGNMAAGVAEKGRAAGKQIEAVAGNFNNAVQKSVKDQPIATLAVAGVLGFVLGALWKS